MFRNLLLFFIDVNECTNFPCVHGTCGNSAGSFECTCDLGWSGTVCDQGNAHDNWPEVDQSLNSIFLIVLVSHNILIWTFFKYFLMFEHYQW